MKLAGACRDSFDDGQFGDDAVLVAHQAGDDVAVGVAGQRGEVVVLIAGAEVASHKPGALDWLPKRR